MKYDLQSQYNNNHQIDHELSRMVEANDRDLDMEHDTYSFGVPTHLNFKQRLPDYDPKTGLWMDE